MTGDMWSGQVLFISGADGKELDRMGKRDVQGWVSEGLGVSMIELPDVNDDGVSDLAIGAVHFYRIGEETSVLIVSGKDREVLHHIKSEPRH
jgi:hypothetical protein